MQILYLYAVGIHCYIYRTHTRTEDKKHHSHHGGR